MLSIRHLPPAVYRYHIERLCRRDVLVIQDEYDPANPTETVTQKLVAILQDIVNVLGRLPQHIIYRDEKGHWDRIRATPDGDFLGFSLLSRDEDDYIVLDQKKAVQLAALGAAF